MQKKWKTENIAIKNLSLWDENARFSDQYFNLPEEELLKYFLSPKFQVSKLAGEIEKDFDLPQLEKLIVWRFNDRNIVLEGNRRIAAYKLMADPTPAGHDSKFGKIGTKIGVTEDFVVECLVTDDLEEGYRFIERKHLNNNNEVAWGSAEVAHHKERRGKAGEKELLRVGITKIVNSLDIANELKEAVLGPGYVTTFWRLIGQTPAYQFFGFSFDDDKKLKIKDKDFDKKLKVIVWDVLKSGYYNGKLFSRLNNKEISSYLQSISDKDYERVSQEIKEVTSKKQKDIFGQEKAISGYDVLRLRKTPITKGTDELFGRTLVLESGKVNDLYRALVDIDKKNRGNDAVLPFLGMALRLLVEIAARVYYEKQGHGQNAKKDQICETFIKEAKKQLKQQQKNEISLTNEWLSDQRNLGAILDKYAHGSIIYKRADILKDSFIVADILDFYFGKKV